MSQERSAAPGHDELTQARNQARTLASANERLVSTLTDAREQIVALKSQLDRLAQPPSTYGVITQCHEDDTFDVISGGRKINVAASTQVEASLLVVGREVVLNEALNIVATRDFERVGEMMVVKEILTGERAIVLSAADDERVIHLAAPIQQGRIRVGDGVLVDARTGIASELIPRADGSELVLEEVPDIEYADIGGLSGQIEQIRDSVELPYLHADLYAQHSLKPPKGVLLYGPPGCGKTMIAKAVAASLAREIAQRDGTPDARAYFLNIKGPELLNKYVGETERGIRTIFHRAREKSSEGRPVVVFFDEMDSLFRTRGTGISSDTEITIVPQLLAEMDGVEGLDNVIVIGATNREDMIDPAILRPGRLDVKIKIERPDAPGARDIFAKYLSADLPLHESVLARWGTPQDAVVGMTELAVERMYATDDEAAFLEVTYAGGDKDILYFKDFASGAMIHNIVDRAKKYAIKDLLDSQVSGISLEHLMAAIEAEFRENEDLPNTTNPDDWARLSGQKGERIVYIRTLARSGEGSGRALDAGQ